MSIIKNNKNYGTRVKILQPEPVPLTSTYFYVEDVSGSDNTLTITRQSWSPMTIEVFASIDGVNWTSMGTTNVDAPLTNTIPANGKLYLKANTTQWGSGWDSGTVINASDYFKVGGNVMSLLNGDNFVNSGFAPNTRNIFDSLFRGCHTLINASELQLPATTLVESCYGRMFYGCNQLIAAPVLPATTLVRGCYGEMFHSCSSLKKIVAYANDISAMDCTGNWLVDVSATGDFYNLGGASYTRNESGIPTGWTEHTSL